MSVAKKIYKIFAQKKSFDIVSVFPFDKKIGKILIIREYLYSQDASIWKFVSGKIDKPNKDIKTHAAEELAEELSMTSENTYEYYVYEKIFRTRRQYCFVAENPVHLDNSPKNPDRDYIIDMRWVDESELWNMIDNREIIWNESVLVALNILRDLKK